MKEWYVLSVGHSHDHNEVFVRRTPGNDHSSGHTYTYQESTGSPRGNTLDPNRKIWGFDCEADARKGADTLLENHPGLVLTIVKATRVVRRAVGDPINMIFTERGLLPE